jgi:hypothetical protein
MSGVKMHCRGAGKAAVLAGLVILALLVVAPVASAAVFLLDDVTLPGDPILIVNGVNDGDGASGPPPANEGVARAIDNTTTKYLNFLDYGSGFIVTPRLPSVVEAIRLYSANDNPARDPASFYLEGANSPTGPFTLIAGNNVSLGARNEPDLPVTTANINNLNFVTFSFPNSTQYTSYRVTFPTVVNGASDVAMQIAEVELLGTLIPEPAALGLLGIGALGLLRRRRI